MGTFFLKYLLDGYLRRPREEKDLAIEVMGWLVK